MLQWRILMEQIDYNGLETPCYIFDQHEFELNIQNFYDTLNSHFSRCVVGYSVKTNSLPYALSLANKMGIYAEVVSEDEYQLALQCGFEKKRIIYNGPMKSRQTFLDAITHGAIVNIESHREINWLLSLPNDSVYKIGIRLNINISKTSPNDADGEDDNSRFGFSAETNEFMDAINTINHLDNVQLVGLHIHRTAHSRSLTFYNNSIQYACDIIKKYSLSLDYLDIGGGYFGIFSNKPTYKQYAETFYNVLHKNGLGNITVIVEPGNAFSASCFSFLTQVIDVKHCEENMYFITTDGSRNDIDPFFKKNGYFYETYSNSKNDIVKKQIITGCSCLEYDRLFEITNSPLLGNGDRILYKNVGAYTLALTPLFIRYYPKVYLMKNNSLSIIREKWTCNEYLQKSIINKYE